MAIGSGSVSHGFQISEIAFRGTPVSAPVFNELDYHGSLLGLQRLPEEKNAAYKKRLLDVYVHRSSASYTGLINGITRELNLQFFTPLTITLQSGVPSAWSPRIEFIDNTVYLWKDVFTKELDIKIERGDPKLDTYFLVGLAAAINTSDTFQTILDNGYNYQRSDSILNQSSSKLVVSQPLVLSRINYLGVPFIDKGSVIFSDLSAFKIEVSSTAEVNSNGKYHIDYQKGLITSFSLPFGNATIQYSFRQEIFVPSASPVILRAIHSPEFQKIMFNQNQQPDGISTSGTPTEKGASIINELLSVVPMYWTS